MKMNKRQHTIILVGVMFLFSACTSQSITSNVIETTQTSDITHIEEEVYEQVLSELYPEGKSFFVFESTYKGASLDKGTFKELSQDTLVDYETKNLETVTLSPSLELGRPIIITNLAKLKSKYRIDDPQINMELDFSAIHRDYPDIAGIVEFSRIGFQPNLEQALVEIAYTDLMDNACTEYTTVLLSRSKNSWVIIAKIHAYECG